MRTLSKVVLSSVIIFASLETAISLSRNYLSSGPSVAPHAPLGALEILWNESIPLSIGSWTLIAISLFVALTLWNRDVSPVWRQSGLDKSVFELVMKMRGGGSRLNLLRSLETPKHRNELSGITGMDWKEVDRHLNLLQKYGLVTIAAQSGSVKIYKCTEQGRILIKLANELEAVNDEIGGKREPGTGSNDLFP